MEREHLEKPVLGGYIKMNLKNNRMGVCVLDSSGSQ
jgi:hypothetical protein